MMTSTYSYVAELEQKRGGHDACDNASRGRPDACSFLSTRVLHRCIPALLGHHALAVGDEQDCRVHRSL
jgi:hypothetical protein